MKVGEISKKMQERTLNWYGHVVRREEEYVGERVMRMDVSEGEEKERKTKARGQNSLDVEKDYWGRRRNA